MSTQEIKCKICNTVLGSLKAATGKVTPVMEDIEPFRLSEGKTLTCPGCGDANTIK